MASRENLALDWAISRWNAEVANRPLQNVHRRALDTTWRQVIRYFGGDDVGLCGPTHDELVAANPAPPKPEPDVVRLKLGNMVCVNETFPHFRDWSNVELIVVSSRNDSYGDQWVSVIEGSPCQRRMVDHKLQTTDIKANWLTLISDAPTVSAPDAMREALAEEITIYLKDGPILPGSPSYTLLYRSVAALRSVEQTGSTAPVPSPDGAAVESAAKYLDDLEGGMLARDADTPSQVAEKLRASTPPPDDVRSALQEWIDQGYIDAEGKHYGSAAYAPKVYAKSVTALRAAPVSAPAREALIEEFSHFPNREGVGRHVAIVDWFLERFTAPTVGTTREQYARAVCEIDGYDYDRERRLAQNGEMSAREIINRAHRYADAILATSAPAVGVTREVIAQKLDQIAKDKSGLYLSTVCTFAMADVILALFSAPDATVRPVSAETLAQLMPSGKWTCPRCNTTHPVSARDAVVDELIEHFQQRKFGKDRYLFVDEIVEEIRSLQGA